MVYCLDCPCGMCTEYIRTSEEEIQRGLSGRHFRWIFHLIRIFTEFIDLEVNPVILNSKQFLGIMKEKKLQSK